MGFFKSDDNYYGPFQTFKIFSFTSAFKGMDEALCKVLDMAQTFNYTLLEDELGDLLRNSRELSSKISEIKTIIHQEDNNNLRIRRAFEILYSGEEFQELSLENNNFRSEFKNLFQLRNDFHSNFQETLTQIEPELKKLMDKAPGHGFLETPSRNSRKYILNLQDRTPNSISACDYLTNSNEQSLDYFLKPPSWRVEDRVITYVVARLKQVLENFLFRNVFMGNTVNNLIRVVENKLCENNSFFKRLVSSRQDRNHLFPHLINTFLLTIFLAGRLNVESAKKRKLAYACLFFDLGMLEGAPLWSRKLLLEENEANLVQKHPDYSTDLMVKANYWFDNVVLNIVKKHHERLDGSGYPEEQTEDEICFLTQIISVVDAFEALGSNRVHREAMTPKESFQYLEENSQKFNPHIVETLKENIGIYPSGTIVRLNTDEIAVVTASSDDPERPQVRLIVDYKGENYSEGNSINLSEESGRRIKKIYKNFKFECKFKS